MIHCLILSWNGLILLNQLKDGLFRNLQNSGHDYSILIRSNGCTDGTVDEVNRWENTKVLSISHNRDNFSQGVNSLFDLAAPNPNDIILLLNNDVIFNDDVSLLKMIKLLKDDVGSVGCKLLYAQADIEKILQSNNYKEKISHGGIVLSNKYGSLPWNYRSGEESDEQACKNRYFQATTAACLITTAQTFIDAGKLCESFFWCFEDVDYGLTLYHKLGKKNIYCGETNISHGTSISLKKNPVNKMFLSNNVNLFKSRWPNRYIDHQHYLDDPNYNLV